MTDIEIIKKALKKRNLDDDCLRISAIGVFLRMEALIREAPRFFSHHDFDGEKLNWLKRAGLINREK